MTTHVDASTQLTKVRAGTLKSPAQLAGAILIDANLDGLDLTGADLHGANLSRASLIGTSLAGANLEGAILFETTFDDADLCLSNLSGANLESASGARALLAGANLAGVTGSGVRLTNASLTNANLSGASLTGCDLSGARLREANLEGVLLNRATLRDTDLSRAKISGSCLDDADMRGAQLTDIKGYTGASWLRVDQRDTNFTGAHLLRRWVLDQNYLHEFRNQSRMNEWVYRLWSLTSDCGRSVSRWGLLVIAQIILFAWFYSFGGVDFGGQPGALSDIYFSVVTITSLGYGEIVPVSSAMRMLVMLEVISGYVMLGGMMSILSNKMARRAG